MPRCLRPLTLVLLVAASPLGAQQTTATISAGISSSRFGADYDYRGAARTMPSLGVAVHQRSARRSSGSFGLLLTYKGASRAVDGPHLTYLEVPMLGLIELMGPTARTQLFLGAGITPAFLIACQRFATYLDTPNPREDVPCNDSPSPQRLDVGIEARGGVRSGPPGRGLVIEVRQVLGLLAPFSYWDRRNRVLSLMAGYQMALPGGGGE